MSILTQQLTPAQNSEGIHARILGDTGRVIDGHTVKGEAQRNVTTAI